MCHVMFHGQLLTKNNLTIDLAQSLCQGKQDHDFNNLLKMVEGVHVLHHRPLTPYGEGDDDGVTNYGLLSP